MQETNREGKRPTTTIVKKGGHFSRFHDGTGGGWWGVGGGVFLVLGCCFGGSV